MHPIVADQIATDIRQRRLEHAEARRRLSGASWTPASTSTGAWRRRQAGRLVALARRLDPAVVETRRLVVR